MIPCPSILLTTFSFVYFSLASPVIISQGSGYGTIYYDVEEPTTSCVGDNFSEQNTGPVSCSPQRGESLNTLGTNYLVAMNNTELEANLDLYCGKQVIVYVNGKSSDLALFIGDGCGRCGTGPSTQTQWNPTGAPGLDFSATVGNKLSQGQACEDGHFEIAFEIINKTIHDFSVPSNVYSSAQSITTLTSAGSVTSMVSCQYGTWRCRDNSRQQCIQSRWITMDTCQAGRTCRGGSNPFCSLE